MNSNCMKSSETLLGYSQIIDNIAKDPSLAKQYKNEEIWRMRYIVDSNIHQQTKQIILWPFRTSSFVPVNIPLGYALGVLPPTVLNTNYHSHSIKFWHNLPIRSITSCSIMKIETHLMYSLIKHQHVIYLNNPSIICWSHFFCSRWQCRHILCFQETQCTQFVNQSIIFVYPQACPLLGIWIANSFNLFFARY